MWTELSLTDWRSVLPLMARLGVKGGQDALSQRKGTHPELSAGSIAHDGTLLVDRTTVIEEWNPSGRVGVHLVWDFKANKHDELLEMMSVDAPLFGGLSHGVRSQLEAIWVPGQRRVVHVVCPGSSDHPFWTWLTGIKEYADGCQLHYQPSVPPKDMASQYGVMFGGLFESATVKPTTDTICVPNGLKVKQEQAHDRDISEWLELVGFDVEQVAMEGPLGAANRKALSVAAAFWASRNWNPETRHLVKPPESDDWAVQVARMGAAPELLVTVRPARLAIKKVGGASPTPQLGDMIACDHCSLFDSCRLARKGSICTIPESEMGELAKLFQTRNADQVVDGLGKLLGQQADRVEQQLAEESSNAGLFPLGVGPHSEELTKMIHGLFDRGVKLAKLLNPELAGRGTSVSVNVGAGAGAALVTGGSPQALAAGIVAQLEAKGYTREQITPELIQRELTMGGPTTDQQAIEATALPVHVPVEGA